MKIRNWTDVPEQPAEAEGVTVRWVIADKDGAPHFAMRIFDIQPGYSTPYHNHWWEHEVYILNGQGVAAGAQGEKAVAPGTVLLVEGNEEHQFRNTGDQVLRFMCLIPLPWLEGAAQKRAP